MFRVLALLLTATFAALSACADTERTVTVGYYPVPGMMEGTEPDAAKSGYAYEYIQEIASRAGWRYKYVCGSFKEVYEKLVRGEIDILPYVNYSEERAKIIAFPSRAMGSERFYLASMKKGAVIASPAELADKKVGSEAGAFDSTPYLELMKANGLASGLVEYRGVPPRWNALEKGELDYTIESSSMFQRNGIYAAYALPGDYPYHLAVTAKRKDLLAELDAVQEQLAQDDPGFLNQLKFKYFSGVPIFKMLSPATTAWLKEHKVIRIGSYEGMRPFVYRDELGNVVGMAPDSLRHVFDDLGVDVRIEWTLYSGRESGLSALRQNEVDLIYPYYHNRADAEREGVIISSVVFGAPFGLLYSGSYSADTLSRVATPAARLGFKYVRDEYPKAMCIRCGSALECVQKVRKGEATSAIVYMPLLQQIAMELDDSKLRIKFLATPCNVCLAARPADAALIGLVNKAIPYLSDLERNEIENRHAIASSAQINDWQFFLTNPSYVLGAAAVLLVMVALFLQRRASRRRASTLEASLEMLRTTNARLSEQKTVQDYLMRSFALACTVSLSDGTFQTLTRDSAFAAAFGESGNWREAVLNFAETYVHPDDRPTLLRLAASDSAANRLKTAASFSSVLRVVFGSEKKTLRMTVVRCGDIGRIAVGFADVPDAITQKKGLTA